MHSDSLHTFMAWVGLLSAITLLSGCAKPCAYDSDCGALAVCRSGFCSEANLSAHELGTCQFSSECAPDEFCQQGSCRLRSGIATPDGGNQGRDGGMDGGSGGPDGGTGPPPGWCDVLDPDEVYLMGAVYGVGHGMIPVTGSPTSFCTRPVYNSATIRGSDGRLVARTFNIINGRVLAFHADAVVQSPTGIPTVIDDTGNDVELPIPPCDTQGELNDMRLNPTTWTNIHRCTPNEPQWYDVNGDPVASHTLLGFQGGAFDKETRSTVSVTDASGNRTTFGPSELEGGFFTTGMVRAAPDGFRIITDDGQTRADTGYPTLLSLWHLGYDGTALKEGRYAAHPADTHFDGLGTVAMTSAGIFYQIVVLPGGFRGILEIRPDGSRPKVIYDMERLSASYPDKTLWVRVESPRVLITGP